MIDRMSDIVSGVCELARAETELILVRARTALIQVAVVVTGLVIALVSIGSILVALTWTLADQMGLPAALTIVGAVGLVLAALIILVISVLSPRLAANDPESERAEIRAKAASAQIKGKQEMDIENPERPALGDSTPKKDRSENGPDPSLEERVIGAVLENPALVAGGALTVVSILGPKRTIRLLGRTTMLVGLVSSALGQMKDEKQEPAKSA